MKRDRRRRRVIDPRFAGPDYGLPDQATIDAIRTAARLEAMLTDPVYEGKSMAGLIAMAKAGEIAPGATCCMCILGARRRSMRITRRSRDAVTGADCDFEMGIPTRLLDASERARFRSRRAQTLFGLR